MILAIGQSADDTYEKLHERGIKMEPKPFAIGLRVEHPQNLINSIQYGKWYGHSKLPPAEYFITAAIDEPDRSVYTFCMCPGGQVIGCSAFPGAVITNGMSKHKRGGEFANSAVVVNVRVTDFAVSGEPLSGLGFRSRWEREAFRAGGGNYCAPAQKMTDFLENHFSSDGQANHPTNYERSDYIDKGHLFSICGRGNGNVYSRKSACVSRKDDDRLCVCGSFLLRF